MNLRFRHRFQNGSTKELRIVSAGPYPILTRAQARKTIGKIDTDEYFLWMRTVAETLEEMGLSELCYPACVVIT